MKNHFINTFLFLFLALFYCDYPVLCLPLLNHNCQNYVYNKTYPLTPALKEFANVTYAVSIISDMDRTSKSLDLKDTWQSFLKKGNLTWTPSSNLISVNWEEECTTLTSNWNFKGRGMELSEFITFDGKLLTFDDKIGMVYFFKTNKIYPWVILMDGDGISSTGFKAEWAAVKDEQLYVGSTGKEFVTKDGNIAHYNHEWVKVISPRGEIISENWSSNYARLKVAINITFPGTVGTKIIQV